MKKYFTIINLMWQRALTYRFSVFTYRIGEMAENALIISMWIAIFGNEQFVKGYTLKEMVTYLLVGNLVDVVTRNWLAGYIANEIKNGKLSLDLIKPLNYLHLSISREIGRISFALVMSFLSNILVVLFFANLFIINYNISRLLMIFAMVLLAFITELFISFLVGLIAFWTDEIDGIFDSIIKLRTIFAGAYFPINILPLFFVKLSYALPFAYSFFVPTQLYLNKISLIDGLRGIFIQITWIVMLYLIIKLVWRCGLKKYESVGI